MIIKPPMSAFHFGLLIQVHEPFLPLADFVKNGIFSINRRQQQRKYKANADLKLYIENSRSRNIQCLV
jgi:hypothetical protein